MRKKLREPSETDNPKMELANKFIFLGNITKKIKLQDMIDGIIE